jgi:hypothetical protein
VWVATNRLLVDDGVGADGLHGRLLRGDLRSRHCARGIEAKGDLRVQLVLSDFGCVLVESAWQAMVVCESQGEPRKAKKAKRTRKAKRPRKLGSSLK